MRCSGPVQRPPKTCITPKLHRFLRRHCVLLPKKQWFVLVFRTSLVELIHFLPLGHDSTYACHTCTIPFINPKRQERSKYLRFLTAVAWCVVVVKRTGAHCLGGRTSRLLVVALSPGQTTPWNGFQICNLAVRTGPPSRRGRWKQQEEMRRR